MCKNFLAISETFSSFQTNKVYHIRQRLTCSSTNIVYLVNCNKCKLQYVGSTTTEFKVRFRNHKSSMKTKKKICEVAIYFNKSPYALEDFSFQCMDQIHATTDEDVEKLLITTEAYWSAQLFSLFPYSLIGGKNSIPKSASIIKKNNFFTKLQIPCIFISYS